MDAPPPQEDVRPFVQVAGLIHAAGLHAPQVLEADDEQGFLLLTDLGHELYLDALRDPARADPLMRDALQALLQWQLRVPGDGLPAFDDAAAAARAGAVSRLVRAAPSSASRWTDAQQRTWDQVCDRLVASALAQPRWRCTATGCRAT
jgi:aminoglycoside/choline kinase family phosphotransferase